MRRGAMPGCFRADKDVANVDLVIGKKFSKEAPARKAMTDFVNKVYPGVTVETVHGGVIPCGYTQV